MESSIFVPSHLTGFFQIVEHPDPLAMGSRGAGVLMDKGVTTNIKTSSKDHKLEIKVNGEKNSQDDTITHRTIDLIQKYFPIKSGLKVEHQVEVPLGCGFGTSAALALGTSLGLTRLLDLPLSFNQATSIAHRAEIEMGTGLGDVIAETSGGIVMRIKEGSPGLGRLDQILCPPLYVVAQVRGEIDTSKIIKSTAHQKIINQWGALMLRKLQKDPRMIKFLELSLRFAQKTSLISSEIWELIEILNEETLGSSMAMLGNTAFALSETPETSIENTIIGKIDFKGIEILK